jgi:hypothetical protein
VTVEELFSMGKAPETITLDDGAVAKRDMGAEKTGRGYSPDNPGWPIECYGSGVNANQAGELRAHFKERGIKCEVTDRGNPVYTDAHHQRKCLKARGFFNKSDYC